MKRLLLLLLLGMMLLPLRAQQTYSIDRFDGLKSEGDIPADLRKTLDQLYNEDKQRVRDFNDGKLRNRDKVLQASFAINRLTANGRILYGDPISRMVERVADTLLKDYPELRKELRFYTVKSPEVNAFATGQGMIFVNIGLIAQVEDEAQLAFVLGHEIVHYYRGHSIEQIIRKSKKSDDYERQLEDFLKYHSRSREMENEADSLGLTMFYIKSPYDKQVTNGFFDVLQYAYLPFDEVPFDTNSFNTAYYHVPEGSFLKKVADITARDDYDDSRSTHPNLKTRREKTAKVLGAYSGGNHYVVTTPQEFGQLLTLARFECIRQDLIYSHYVRAYYNAFVLQREYPDNHFLALSRAQALYGLAMYKSYTGTNTVAGDYKEQEGEMQQLSYCFRKIDATELSLLAMRQLWRLHQQNPSDAQVTALCEDMMTTLHDKHGFVKSSFSATFDTARAAAVEDNEEVNQKYARIKQKRQNQQKVDLRRYVFTDIMQQDATFEPFMERCFNHQHPTEEQLAEQRQQRAKEGGLFLFAPGYYVIDLQQEELKIRKSDRKEEQMSSNVEAAAKAAHLDMVDFTDPVMRSHTDAQFYNDFVSLNEWTNEFWQSRGDVPMLLSTQPQMNRLTQGYGADKLSLNVVANGEYIRKPFKGYAVILGTIIFPALPLAANYIFTGRETTITRTLLIDATHGRVLSENADERQLNDSPTLVKSDIYANIANAADPDKAPGYLGHRLLVSAQMGLDFPIINRYIGDREPGINFDWRPALSVEYAYGKTHSLNVWADMNRTVFDIKDLSSAKLIDADIISLAVTNRSYFKHNYAPLGPYFGYGAMVSHLSQNPHEGYNSMYYLDSTYWRAGIHLELGRNIIVADRVAINYGARYTITLANPFSVMDIDYNWSIWHPTEVDPDAIKNDRRMMNANLTMRNLIMLHLGIGLLP